MPITDKYVISQKVGQVLAVDPDGVSILKHYYILSQMENVLCMLRQGQAGRYIPQGI